MGQLSYRTYKQILTRMNNKVVARTDLNDLTDTSGVKHVLAAAAREDDDQYFRMRRQLNYFDLDKCFGDDLDARIKDLNPKLIGRLGAQRATGTVVFSRVGTVGIVTIPVGTEVKKASGERYRTTAQTQILAGAHDSVATAIEAVDAGANSNADPGVITIFGVQPSGVDSVTNGIAATGGRNKESDDELRGRAKAFLRSLSRATNVALLSAVFGAVDVATGKRVLFASLWEDPVNRGNVIIYIDDGSGTAATTAAAVAEPVVGPAVGGEIDLYLDHPPVQLEYAYSIVHTPFGLPATPISMGSDYLMNPASGHVKLTQATFPTGLGAGDAVSATYQYFTGLIAEAKKIVDGDPSNRATYPGYRAAGVLVRVLSPWIVPITVEATVNLLQGFDRTSVLAKVRTAIMGYINTLGIGEDVVLAELIERAMGVAGVYDVQFVAPAENRVITDSQLARSRTSDITLS